MGSIEESKKKEIFIVVVQVTVNIWKENGHVCTLEERNKT